MNSPRRTPWHPWRLVKTSLCCADIKFSVIPLNLHVSVYNMQLADTHFTTLVQPSLYCRLYRKRTSRNCNPVGPSASRSVYIWCQVFTKSAISFLPPKQQPFIKAERILSSLGYIPTSTSVVSTLSLANLLATGLKLTSRSSQHVSGLQTWCRSVLLRVCVSMPHGPPECCRIVCMQTECQGRCPVRSNIRMLQPHAL